MLADAETNCLLGTEHGPEGGAGFYNPDAPMQAVLLFKLVNEDLGGVPLICGRLQGPLRAIDCELLHVLGHVCLKDYQALVRHARLGLLLRDPGDFCELGLQVVDIIIPLGALSL